MICWITASPKIQMKNLVFDVTRSIIRFLFLLPGGVRHAWRTLLVWTRLAWIYHRSGTEGLKRFRSVRGVSKDNLRPKSMQESDNNRTQPPLR